MIDPDWLTAALLAVLMGRVADSRASEGLWYLSAVVMAVASVRP